MVNRTVYHGTKKKHVASIQRDGFHARTYFATNIADALHFGGDWVFGVVIGVDGDAGWQIFSCQPVLPKQILWIRHYDWEQTHYNDELGQALKNQCLEGLRCLECSGHGEILTEETKQRFREGRHRINNQFRPCLTCGGYGYVQEGQRE